MLTREVPAAAEVAAANAAAEMTATEAAHVAEVSGGEMTATELAAAEAAHVAEVSAGEMSPAAVESEATVEAVVKAVLEAAPSDEGRTTKPVAIVVIRIRVSVTIVVARAIIRPIVVIAAVRIAGRDAANHSGRDSRAGIIAVAVCIAVRVAVTVGVDVAVMVGGDAPVYTRDLPMDASSSMMNAMGGVMNDRRRAGGGEPR